MSTSPNNQPPNRRSGGRWRVFWQRVSAAIFGERILCDTCKYDYGVACTRRERPNATQCEDYAGR